VEKGLFAGRRGIGGQSERFGEGFVAGVAAAEEQVEIREETTERTYRLRGMLYEVEAMRRKEELKA
jgi:hypothetical protein